MEEDQSPLYKLMVAKAGIEPATQGFSVLRLPPQLQPQIQRVMPALHQISPVKPQPLLPRRLPHVAQLALPRAGVVLGV